MTDLRLELDQEGVPVEGITGWKVAVVEACPKHQMLVLIAVSPTMAQAIREKRVTLEGKRGQVKCVLQSVAKLLALFFHIPVTLRGEPPGMDPAAFTFTAAPLPPAPATPPTEPPAGPRLN